MNSRLVPLSLAIATAIAAAPSADAQTVPWRAVIGTNSSVVVPGLPSTSRSYSDVLLGDATLFPRNAEVEASWRVIDPLEEYWSSHPPEKYRAGEWGPKKADEMLEDDGRVWRRP